MFRLTASLLNSWLYATDPEASEEAYASFLDTLEHKVRPKTRAMETGIAFEDLVTRLAQSPKDLPEVSENDMRIAIQMAKRVGRGVPQVRAEKTAKINGLPIQLVGVADWLGAGILSDIKRVQRYEYGKYQFSTQHPMYLELFPEAMRFDYLIYDGQFFYIEQYRRGDCRPISESCGAFLKYLDDADLMETYQKNWRVNE